MSPDTNGNPPNVVKRKKRPKEPLIPIDNCCPPYNHFNNSSHAYNLSMPNVSHYSLGSTSSPQLVPFPNFSLNCDSWLTNSSIGNSPHIPGYSDPTEYSSLPVVMQSNESGKRRFSDPGLPNDSDSSSNCTENGDIQKLKLQVHHLKEQNRRLSKENLDLRTEISVLKQNGFKSHSREYEPGLLTDIIKEVREAARVREDAFFARVKHLLEEQQQQLGMNHMQILTEKHRNSDRICKLEEQLKNLNLTHSFNSPRNDNSKESHNGNSFDSTWRILELEKEAVELRRELKDTRAKKEASDQKLVLLDKRRINLIRHKDNSDTSDDFKTESPESSTPNPIRTIPIISSKITLSGPVTDL